MKREQLDNISVCKVYWLSSSKDGEIRYVGQTQTSLSKRLASHLNIANNTNSQSHVYRWIKKELEQGNGINIHLLEDNAVLNESEIRWIDFYRKAGANLTNISAGGDRGCFGIKRSEETKKLMRHPKSVETRIKMMKPKSSATKSKMKVAQIGNTKSRGEANRHAVLNQESVVRIKILLANGGSVTKIAREYGLQKAAISKIKNGRTWKHVSLL